TIPDTALLTTPQTFTFHVKNAANQEVATPTLTFNPGGVTSQSTIVDNLAPGMYTVIEDPLMGWVTDTPQTATINRPECSGSVDFANVQVASPSATTQADPTTGTVGQMLTVGDSASITGGDNPSGSVTFTLYSDDQCTTAVAGVSGDGMISGGS